LAGTSLSAAQAAAIAEQQAWHLLQVLTEVHNQAKAHRR
jgi:hypothetical protein